MNISFRNLSCPSFGVVKKDAVKRAVEMVNGDINKLSEIRDTIQIQSSNNRYDIRSTFKEPSKINFVVQKRGQEGGPCFDTLKKASDSALYYAAQDEKIEEFNKAVIELLNLCED